MDTPLIGEEEEIENSHGGYLNQWVGGQMHITVQTSYGLQYLTMYLCVYMNDPTVTVFLESHTWNGISYAPFLWTYNVSKKELSKEIISRINVYSNQAMQK